MALGRTICSAACAVALAFIAVEWSAPAHAQDEEADEPLTAAEPAASNVARLVDWVLASRDNNGLPFLIIDKLAAVVFVYGADGQSVAAEPALLGSARGDDSAPGVGDRELSAIPPEERTTPAGRFVAAYGPAFGRTTVLWVDFATAISLHPVVTGNRGEHRRERLQSASPDDNFITYGCINVSPEFYKGVIHVMFKDTPGVVYILPDSKPLDEVFPSLPPSGQGDPPP